MDYLTLLAKVALDAFLLARSAETEERLPDGRAWERASGELLWQPEMSRRQYAGSTSLFNRTSLSGCRHELDGCASGWAGHLIIECKAKANGVDKSDVALFHLKTFDYYWGNLQAAHTERWWTIMVSAGAVTENIRRLCLQTGVILCDPSRLPLPVLLRAATRPVADQYLPETKLAELVRLGESACYSIQQLWRLDSAGELCFQPRQRRDIDDLLWLQEELSNDLLELYNQYKPGVLAQRANYLRNRLTAANYA